MSTNVVDKLMNRKARILGCIYGGAIGDAVGYPVEFKSVMEANREIDEIMNSDKLVCSDDTQMMLFTMTGLINSYKRGEFNLKELPTSTWNEYQKWLITQERTFDIKNDEYNNDILLKYKQLYARRAPGNTCLSALHGKRQGSIKGKPLNNSKGCGGIMRVAPIGVILSNKSNYRKEIAYTGAEISALTHSHPLGYIPSYTLTELLNRITYDVVSHKRTPETFIKMLNICLEGTKEVFMNTDPEDCKYFIDLVNKAVELAVNTTNDLKDRENIASIGEGWVAEETFAIAVYCVIRHMDDFEKAIKASVVHNGDSDSTGMTTGNILGAIVGVHGLPEKLINSLDLKEPLEELGTKLCKM